DKRLEDHTVAAMLDFGKENWPDDFLLVSSSLTLDTCDGGYTMGLELEPRALKLLAVVLQPKHRNLDIAGFSFLKDNDESLRKLKSASSAYEASEGVVSLAKDEALIIPLKIELRYEPKDFKFFDPSKKIRNDALASFKTITTD